MAPDLPETNRGYIVAFVSVVTATIAVLLLRDFLSRSMFILFAAPIAMSAWYAGRGPAIFATVLGVLAADVIFIENAMVVISRRIRETSSQSASSFSSGSSSFTSTV